MYSVLGRGVAGAWWMRYNVKRYRVTIAITDDELSWAEVKLMLVWEGACAPLLPFEADIN